MQRSATPDSKSLNSNNPFRDSTHGSPKLTSSTTKELKPAFERSYPSPPASTSPRPRGSASPRPHGSPNHRKEVFSEGNRPRRSSSLRERYPGDPSVSPLNQLAKEKAVADRARHITKKHAVRPDTIDSLDASGIGAYHHEGPYDATLFARNNSWRSSPVAAVAESNNEALKATPHDKIVDSIQGHRPLDGVAAFPPGTTDRNGQTYRYKEGDNMMTEENAPGGPYKRWSGIQYHPDDIKGKGEPSYTIERALKEKGGNEKDANGLGIELQSDANKNRRRSGSGVGLGSHHRSTLSQDNDGLTRSSSLTNRLKKRVVSLTKKD